MSRVRGRPLLLIGALLAVALPLALDALIETDEERVEATLSALEAGLEARDAQAVLAACAPEVVLHARLPGLSSRAPFASVLRDGLARLGKLSLNREPARLDPLPDGRFRVDVHGDAFAVMQRLGAGSFPLSMKLLLVEGADGRLLLAEVESLEVSLPRRP